MMQINEGGLFIISSGTYDYYGVDCLMRSLEDIDVPAVWDEWIASGGDTNLRQFLIGKQMAEELSFLEIGTGEDYHHVPWPNDKKYRDAPHLILYEIGDCTRGIVQ